jgi:16S rRNA (uracil1498-N3)-methyltransferase
MREDRFFIDIKIEKGKLEISEKEIFHQLKDVLRKRAGDRIILFNGTGIEAEAEIKKFLKDKVEVEILKIEKPEREPKIFVSLFCSVLKKSNFELVVQKATEIGVGEIAPILCKNTVKTGLNLKRLEKIAKEAAEQSKRVTLPKIEKILSFKEAIEKARNFDLKILFDISGKNLSFLKRKVKNVAIFIGPEGGWDKSEIELAKKENFEILNLGKLNLRSETAAIVASFLIIHYYLRDRSILKRNQ